MNYSTLKEVYNVDTFEREKKKKKKIKSEEIEDEYSVSVPAPVDKDIIKSPKITNIQPYYDEELEQYLQVNTESNVSPIYPSKDISNESNEINIQKSSNLPINIINPIIPSSEPSNQIAKTSLNTTHISQNSNINTPIIKDTKKEQFYKNMINIGLFIFIGILIIFLCDQITEISINIGMKKTMTLMESYLQEIRAKKDN